MSSCIFCKILKHEIPAKILFEDESVAAFHDINPQAPVHILLIPKKHVPSVMALSQEDLSLFGHMAATAQKLAQEQGADQTGFRIVINNGPDAGQAVDHLHWHILAGRKLSWPPG